MQEKIIEFLPGYFVDIEGKVYSTRRKAKMTELKGGVTTKNKNYKIVCLTVDGKRKMKYVHRIVAETFIPNPENLPQVNHKDGNPLNNCVKNLEWVTNSGNQAHAYKTGLHSYKFCVLCGKKTYARKFVFCEKCKSTLITAINSYLISKSRKELALLALESNLSEKERQVFTLRSQGMTYKEIGEKLGCTKQNIGLIIKKCFEDMDLLLKEEKSQDDRRKINTTK